MANKRTIAQKITDFLNYLRNIIEGTPHNEQPKEQPQQEIEFAFVSRVENAASQSMADWTSERKLNDVLRYLSNYYYRNAQDEGYDSGFVPYTQFEKYMDTRSVWNSECLSLVLYLSRDNKIDIYPSEEVMLKASMKTPEKLRLNFEGFMFHNNFGYVRQKTDREKEATRKITTDARMVSSTRYLNRGTWALAGITFLLLIVGILDYLDKHPSYHHFHHHFRHFYH